MEVWTWILAYVVGFSLLQLLVYRYVRDSEPSVEGPAPGEGYTPAPDRVDDSPVREADDSDPGTDDPTVRCPRCGTRNAEIGTVRYCRACVAPLR